MVVDRHAPSVGAHLQPQDLVAFEGHGADELRVLRQGVQQVATGVGGRVQPGGRRGQQERRIDVIEGERPRTRAAGDGLHRRGSCRDLGGSCPVAPLLGNLLLPQGEDAGDEGQDEQTGADRQCQPLTPDQAELRAFALRRLNPFLLGVRLCGGEEVALDVGELRTRTGYPLPGAGQPQPAIELARRPAQRVPRVGGGTTWCRIRCPSASSSSQPRSRGHVLASDSCARVTTSASLVSSRAATRTSTSPVVARPDHMASRHARPQRLTLRRPAAPDAASGCASTT